MTTLPTRVEAWTSTRGRSRVRCTSRWRSGSAPIAYAAGNAAEGDAFGIFLAHRRGQDDAAQRQDGDPARAGERGKQRADERGNDRQPPGPPPEPALRRAHQPPGSASLREHVSGYREQRD